MLALQFSIGAANDLLDERDDGVAKPAKPLPAGLIDRRAAQGIAVGGGIVGLAAAALHGTAVLSVAVAGYALGLLYDLGLKRTPWGWLAFAFALPLVPAFAWLAASGELPPRFGLLAGLGLLAGAALAVANGLVDLPGDAASGSRGVAVSLGRRGGLALVVVAETAVAFVVAVTLLAPGEGIPTIPTWLVGAAVLGGSTCCIAGWRLSADPAARRREAGWELQAVGLGLLALGWFAGQPG